MIENLEHYFCKEQKVYLENIKYSRLDTLSETTDELLLNCSDVISATMCGTDRVQVSVTRKLQFEPNNMFEMEVCFSAILILDRSKADEIEWEKVNLAEEFRKNGNFVLGNLMSRVTLLIAQITSSCGQAPLVLPPAIVQKY